MEENFGEQVIPGTYVRVQSEGLITAPSLSTGLVGIVGTAQKAAAPGDGSVVPEVVKVVQILSSMDDARRLYAASDAIGTAKYNLMRSLDLLFRNGASVVYAYALDTGATVAEFTAGATALVNRGINILIAPELSTSDAKSVLGVAETAESEGKDVLTLIGCDTSDPALITALDATGKNFTYIKQDKRVVMCAPGVKAYEPDATSPNKGAVKLVALPGSYTAAAVAGLVASLAPQGSPTNKALPAVTDLARHYTYGEKTTLLKAGILALENNGGIRVIRGLTTDPGAFKQVTTRRIVDYAKAGIRGVSNPFVGKLNNERVRKALQGAVDNFLTTMVVDEALTAYSLEVKASRADEISGRCVVNVALQPTFSIDFIRVTLALS
jgi:phage tail sheath protein FI